MPKIYAPQVKNYARQCFRNGYSATETLRIMRRVDSLAEYDLPETRTIQVWFNSFRKEEEVTGWTLEDTPNEDAQIVLRHFKRVCEWAVKNDVPMPIISKVIADRLIWVHKAAPDIPLGLAWRLANEYFDDSDNKAYWNLFLATAPWQSEEANHNFYRLAESFFGSPIGDLSKETIDEYHKRYPLGSTNFHLFWKETS